MMRQRPYGKLLVVLDSQLETESARQLLVLSGPVGLAACLLPSVGAVLLIRRMAKPVQESFDKQKQFVWDASRELKTPLAIISANSEALVKEIGEIRWMNYIQSEVQHTDQLVKICRHWPEWIRRGSSWKSTPSICAGRPSPWRCDETNLRVLRGKAQKTLEILKAA
ncbi:hypothetical protein [Oscillibacter sp.]|uniref:hypothetical protein n=1 Tax=Oscillibacter sp. TaxID=1945593 RepID=UPI00339AD378